MAYMRGTECRLLGRIEKREPVEWWILIKKHNGQRGWTRQYDHFIGKDLFG
jgi:hypothetical protein